MVGAYSSRMGMMFVFPGLKNEYEQKSLLDSSRSRYDIGYGIRKERCRVTAELHM